jgi:hypothetical protein
MMEHYYKNLGEDWFSYPRIYRGAVKYFGSGSTFVEVGSWRGRSSVYMGVEIVNSGKEIALFCVDTWEGSVEHQGWDILDDDGLWKDFQKNIEPLKGVITPARMTSLEGAAQFFDNTLDFVFIDAAHDYQSVKEDIEAWYPKVKEGGVISGHDYAYWEGVKKAVDERFGKDMKARYGSWVHQKGAKKDFYRYL